MNLFLGPTARQQIPRCARDDNFALCVLRTTNGINFVFLRKFSTSWLRYLLKQQNRWHLTEADLTLLFFLRVLSASVVNRGLVAALLRRVLCG